MTLVKPALRPPDHVMSADMRPTNGTVSLGVAATDRLQGTSSDATTTNGRTVALLAPGPGEQSLR